MDAHGGLIESFRQAAGENVIDQFSLTVEAHLLSLLRSEVLTSGPESPQPDLYYLL